MKVNKDKFYLFVFIILETIAVKLLQYKIFPSKYFYDSKKILAIMNGSPITDKAYSFTANVFNKINIFGFTTLQQWSIFIAIIFIFILLIILARDKKYNYTQSIFILGSVGLLNIYVFNLSKDIVQFIFFLILYLILKNNKWDNKIKLFWCCVLLIYIAYAFRVYYLIMAVLMVTIYFVFTNFIKGRSLTKSNAAKIIIITLILFFMEIFILQLLSKSNYNAIINARSSVNSIREDSIDAITLINDMLGSNTNYSIFVGNYLINMVRMILPVELIFKGFKYIPFIIYQFFVTYNIINLGKKLNESNILWFATAVSFIMMSVIFEPDYGSFIRHESALILILLMVNKINNNKGMEGKDD